MKKVMIKILSSEVRYSLGLINPLFFSLLLLVDLSSFCKLMIFIKKIIFLYNDINKSM